MVATVVIVDDHPLICRGLVNTIESSRELVVVGVAHLFQEAINVVSDKKPDLVIVDLSLSDGNGFDLMHRIKRLSLQTQMLDSSMRDEQIFAQRCLKAGARGYVAKHESPEVLLSAIHAVLAGEVWLSELMTSRLLRDAVGSPEDSVAAIETLSERELEVLLLLGEGRKSRDIADRLHLSIKTIDSFRERIKAKLGIDSATQLIHFATSLVLT